MSRKEHISNEIAKFADKYDLSDEQAIKIVYNVNAIKKLWNIVGLEDYLLDVSRRFEIEL